MADLPSTRRARPARLADGRRRKGVLQIKSFLGIRLESASSTRSCIDWSPSVHVANDCVSPLVNTTDPWAVGRGAMSMSMGLTVVKSRPSLRRPSLRTSAHMALDESFFSTLELSALV